MYAIIEDSGSQIKVSQGDVIKVDLRDLPADVATLTFDRVLMVAPTPGKEEDGQLKIGAPVVAGAKVVADILAQEKGPKIDIWKYRRRKNYKRHRGHRQEYLKVKITSIEA